mmetsp:Transcript_46798/g.142048  ORF Transcript_46798/g.142048 Transcript_46798/m.142048 type:complete len:203 (-) Transcript_46798:245-853(-)
MPRPRVMFLRRAALSMSPTPPMAAADSANSPVASEPISGISSCSQVSAQAMGPTTDRMPTSRKPMPQSLLKLCDDENLPKRKSISTSTSMLLSMYNGTCPAASNSKTDMRTSAVGVIVMLAAIQPAPADGRLVAGISLMVPTGARSCPIYTFAARVLFNTTLYGFGLWQLVLVMSWKCMPVKPWSNQTRSTVGASSLHSMGR